jgi:hypothetical protein
MGDGEGLPVWQGDGGSHWSSKKPWNMVEYSQPGPASQWQDQGKRQCYPGSLGNANTQTYIQMQMPSDMQLDMASLLPNAELEPAAFVEPSMSLFSLHETRGPLGSNNDFGDSPVNLEASINSWANCSLQPAVFPTTLSGTLNTPEDSEISLANLNLPTSDFLGASKPISLWHQPGEFVNDMALTSVGFSGVGSSHFSTGSSFWRRPNQLHTQAPQLQFCPPGVALFNSRGLPKSSVHLNQDSVLHTHLLHDIEDHSTEGKMSEVRFVQSQRLDSFEGNSTPSSMNDKFCQTSYEYNQNASASDTATAQLLHDSKYPSYPDSVLSTQFENDTLHNVLAEHCSSFRIQIPQNHGKLDNTPSDKYEETDDIGYDTCFGTVSLLNGNSTI